jgi:hypothetical protein
MLKCSQKFSNFLRNELADQSSTSLTSPIELRTNLKPPIIKFHLLNLLVVDASNPPSMVSMVWVPSP